jgi:hypothetical protein
MPTFQVYQNGVQKQELVGASERDLQAMIEKFA